MKTQNKIIIGVVGLYALKKISDRNKGVSDSSMPMPFYYFFMTLVWLLIYGSVGAEIIRYLSDVYCEIPVTQLVAAGFIGINILIAFIAGQFFLNSKDEKKIHLLHQRKLITDSEIDEILFYDKRSQDATLLTAYLTAPFYFIFMISFFGLKVFGWYHEATRHTWFSAHAYLIETDALVIFTILAGFLPILATGLIQSSFQDSAKIIIDKASEGVEFFEIERKLPNGQIEKELTIKQTENNETTSEEADK